MAKGLNHEQGSEIFIVQMLRHDDHYITQIGPIPPNPTDAPAPPTETLAPPGCPAVTSGCQLTVPLAGKFIPGRSVSGVAETTTSSEGIVAASTIVPSTYNGLIINTCEPKANGKHTPSEPSTSTYSAAKASRPPASDSPNPAPTSRSHDSNARNPR